MYSRIKWPLALQNVEHPWPRLSHISTKGNNQLVQTLILNISRVHSTKWMDFKYTLTEKQIYTPTAKFLKMLLGTCRLSLFWFIESNTKLLIWMCAQDKQGQKYWGYLLDNHETRKIQFWEGMVSNNWLHVPPSTVFLSDVSSLKGVWISIFSKKWVSVPLLPSLNLTQQNYIAFC